MAIFENFAVQDPDELESILIDKVLFLSSKISPNDQSDSNKPQYRRLVQALRKHLLKEFKATREKWGNPNSESLGTQHRSEIDRKLIRIWKAENQEDKFEIEQNLIEQDITNVQILLELDEQFVFQKKRIIDALKGKSKSPSVYLENQLKIHGFNSDYGYATALTELDQLNIDTLYIITTDPAFSQLKEIISKSSISTQGKIQFKKALDALQKLVIEFEESGGVFFVSHTAS